MLATRLCPLAHSSAVLASVGPRQRGSRAPMEDASDGLRMAGAGLGRPPTLGGAALQPAVDASLHGRGDACTSGSAEQSTVPSSVDGAHRSTTIDSSMVPSATESVVSLVTSSGSMNSHGDAGDVECKRCKGNHHAPHTCGSKRRRPHVEPVQRSSRRRGESTAVGAPTPASGPPVAIAVEPSLPFSGPRSSEDSSSVAALPDHGAALGMTPGDGALPNESTSSADGATLTIEGGAALSTLTDDTTEPQVRLSHDLLSCTRVADARRR